MANNKLVFKDAEKVRDTMLASQKKQIAGLYQQWADEIGEMADHYAHRSSASSAVSERQMRELQKMMEQTSKEVANEVHKSIKQNIYAVADSVVQCNNQWLASLGFNEGILGMTFNHVPDSIVRKIVTGQVYDSGWSLSSRIWSENEAMLKQTYEIVAGGVAQNKPIYEIAKDLEKYVSPSAAKPWNLKSADGKKIYPKQVDYNAQRLARTLVQHGYQQSFVETTKNNPLIIEYVWLANGSRACEFCQAMNGKKFPKDDLPLDHPNGMCTMVPDVSATMTDDLANWFNAPDGIYPELDKFASNFGYKPIVSTFNSAQKKYLLPYGFDTKNMPKSFDDWSYKVSKEHKTEILELMGTNWKDPHPYQKMQKYFVENLGQFSTTTATKLTTTSVTKGSIASLGTSSGKTFNYWYTKLDANQKVVAKELKGSSGLSWQQWYEKNIYVGKGVATKTQVTQQPTGANTKSWIKTIRSQKEDQMLAMEKNQLAAMTQAQRDGVTHYTGSNYRAMNGYLRAEALGDVDRINHWKSELGTRQFKIMENAKEGLSQTTLPENLVLRRGTDLGDLAGFMPGDFYANKGMLEQMGIEQLKNTFEGTVGTYAGFTSTSSMYSRGFSGQVEILFNAPAGTHGSSIMGISKFGKGEGELLLKPGTKVVIKSVEESDGHMGSSIRVLVEIIDN